MMTHLSAGKRLGRCGYSGRNIMFFDDDLCLLLRA
jgi:hypothetical protein